MTASLKLLKRVNADDFGPVAEEDHRPDIAPGEYMAMCVGKKIYHSNLLRGWKACLVFQLMDGREETVAMFFNLGDGPDPKVAAKSKYRRTWELAAGRKARKDRMYLKEFVGKVYRVRIDYTGKTYDGCQQNEISRYSVVREILSVGA